MKPAPVLSCNRPSWTLKELSGEMAGSCERTVKRVVKRFQLPADLPPDPKTGAKLWSHERAARLVKLWREFWIVRGQSPATANQKFTGGTHDDADQTKFTFHAITITQKPEINFAEIYTARLAADKAAKADRPVKKSKRRAAKAGHVRPKPPGKRTDARQRAASANGRHQPAGGNKRLQARSKATGAC
jgi:hypothetical protein